MGRFLRPPAGHFFLFGPRGTGKSTWLAQQFQQALRLDLLAPEVLRAYQARPERLRERIATARGCIVGTWLAALRAFRQDYPEAECCLVSFAPEPLVVDAIRCEPIEPWLRGIRG